MSCCTQSDECRKIFWCLHESGCSVLPTDLKPAEIGWYQEREDEVRRAGEVLDAFRKTTEVSRAQRCAL